MRSLLVTSVVVVAGTLLTLVQALDADKDHVPATPKHLKIPSAALSYSSDSSLESDALQNYHPSRSWKFNLDGTSDVNRQNVHPHDPQHRRSYDTPLLLGKRASDLLKESHMRSKRSADFDELSDIDDVENFENAQKREMDIPHFLGRRHYDSPQFIGRRGYGPPAFIGKKDYDVPKFLGKKAFAAPAFVGKREYGPPSFVGRRAFTAPSFVGRRAFTAPRFIGRRTMDIPSFIGKRKLQSPMFLGKRGYAAPSFVGKRGFDAPAFIGKRKEESFRDLLATLQAYREYRRLMQTDKRFEAPLFVGKRSDSIGSLSEKQSIEVDKPNDVRTKILLPLDDLHKVDSSKMDDARVQLWDTDIPRPHGTRYLKLDPSHALGFLGQGESQISKRYLEFVGKRDNDKRYAEFVGKRGNDKRYAEFVGKRDYHEKRYDRGTLSEYLSKRLRIRRPEFVGKRANQKRYLEFIGR